MNHCLHSSQIGKLSPPASFSKVYKEECTLCFENAGSPGGIDVCLSCFNGSCNLNEPATHSTRHYRKTGHCLALNIQRKASHKGCGEDGGPRTSKIQKVEILPEEGTDYEYDYLVKCLVCAARWAIEDPTLDSTTVKSVVKGIIETSSAQKRVEAQAWQEEEIPCDHTRRLQQEKGSLTYRMTPRDRCAKCALQENLWMCLTCGAIGCGRKQFDGSGGNGHGAEHYEETGHAVAVKLGTITPEGTADVHCYTCNEMRMDPKLTEHLTLFGIDTADVERTERTMAELQIEQNTKFDFSMVSSDGEELEAVYGAGLTGLKNLGNSCYISSVIQSLFTLPPFKNSYAIGGSDHVEKCQKDPASCFVCQSVKLASAIWSEGETRTIAPWMFKAVAVSGHSEFNTTRQQDASEFLAYLLKVIQRSDPQNAPNLVDPFTFMQQQTLGCGGCGDLRYQHNPATLLPLQISNVLQDNNATAQDCLPLTDFLAKHFAADTVQSSCSHCGAKQKQRQSELVGLSEYLIISLSRYILRNWVPQKIEMEVDVPFEGLDLSPYLGERKQSSKVEEPMVDESALQELVSMGFPRAKCNKALLETGNQGTELAMNWIFEHEDLGVEETHDVTPSVPAEMVQMLMDAGFSAERAKRALMETNCDMERAFDWILSHPNEEVEDGKLDIDHALYPSGRSAKYDLTAFVSHRGPSVHCGHYIAHIRDPQNPQRWIMCNDERVVVTNPQPPIQAARSAYLYIYRRRS